MSDDSPLFVSAIELLAHSTELYTQGNERKYKFAILHLANAVELILKDRLIDKGVSIYIPKKSQTIRIWDSFDRLEKAGIKIPERPVLELLIDDRNTIQHRFGFPNAQTVYFYLGQVVAFFKRFLDEEYGVALADALKPYLSEEDLAILRLAEEEDEYAPLDKLFSLSPESAVLQAYNLLESRLIELMGVDLTSRRQAFTFWRDRDFPHLLDDLVTDEFISADTARGFDFLHQMRNRAAHTAHFEGDEYSPDWAEALRIAKEFLLGLDSAIEDDYFSKRQARKSGGESNGNGDDADSQVIDEGGSESGE